MYADLMNFLLFVFDIEDIMVDFKNRNKFGAAVLAVFYGLVFGPGLLLWGLVISIVFALRVIVYPLYFIMTKKELRKNLKQFVSLN